MKSKGLSRAGGRFPAEERGDVSTKALHRTIGVCAVGLVGVLLFAFSPRKKSAPAPTVGIRSEAKVSSASFDRQSLSTKNR